MSDILLSEYKRRIEKIKTEEELERIALDEIRELKKKTFSEYETKRDDLEILEEKVRMTENKLLELQNKEIHKYNYIVEMADGSLELLSKKDIEIASEEDLKECKECEF